MDLVSVFGDPIAAVAEVIFYIPATHVALGIRVFEFSKNLAGALGHDVGENIQTATVGHSDDDLIHLMLAGLFNGEVQQRDQAFGAFQRKTFRS